MSDQSSHHVFLVGPTVLEWCSEHFTGPQTLVVWESMLTILSSSKWSLWILSCPGNVLLLLQEYVNNRTPHNPHPPSFHYVLFTLLQTPNLKSNGCQTGEEKRGNSGVWRWEEEHRALERKEAVDERRQKGRRSLPLPAFHLAFHTATHHGQFAASFQQF